MYERAKLQFVIYVDYGTNAYKKSIVRKY